MSPAKPQATQRNASQNRKDPPEVVDPIWLIKALSLSLAGALVCGYAALCFLYYQGAWQLLLHPSHVVDRTPASFNISFADVHFDSTETGQPRLTGWWIPAESLNGTPARYAAFTVLYLHDGSGSLSGTVPTLTELHRAGLNIFAIDYRGFGASDSTAHPSEERMSEDAAAAFDYLTATRHIPAENIIPYGTGLGSSLAANLAANNRGVQAVILDNPDPDPASVAAAQTSRLIPARMLMGRPFDIAKSVSTLTIPKLLIDGGPNSPSSNRDERRLEELFKRAASPSFKVTLPADSGESYQTSLERFLDQYLSAR